MSDVTNITWTTLVIAKYLGKELTPEVATMMDNEIENPPKQTMPETTYDFLMRCLKGNKDAVRWSLDLIYVSNIWDDLIDKDIEVTPKAIDLLCETALLSMGCNPFFQQHSNELAPVMRSSIRNWKIANAMSYRSPESRIQSHVLRYSPIDLIIACAAIVGGDDWAVSVGPEIRERHMADDLIHYLQELASRDYDIETDEYVKHGCRIFQSCFLGETEEKHVSKLIELIDPPTGSLIGDFGCGIGEVSRLMSLQDETLNFFLVTNSKRQIELLPEGNRFIPFFGSFDKPSAPPESLDVAMFNQSIGYVNLSMALKESYESLKPGGVLAIYDFSLNGGVNPAGINWGYATHSPCDFVECASRIGFEDVCIMQPQAIENKVFSNLFKNSDVMRNIHNNCNSTSSCIFIKARKPC